MSTTVFTIDANQVSNPNLESLRQYIPDVEITSYAVGARRGGVPATTATIEIDENTVVVAEFENNIKWFYDKAAFTAKIKQQQPAGRSAATGRGLEIPVIWQEGGPSRGLISGMLKLLGISVVKKTIGKSVAKTIAARIEEKNSNVLYQCDRDFNLVPFNSATSKDTVPKYLLFLHGTGSSTSGSFYGLKKEQNGKVYDALFKKYNGNLIAYEHRTFTQNPVRNVIDLLKQLPDNVNLDLVSHSRGGLVGEVLARIGKAEERRAFTKKETDLLGLNEEAVGLLADITELHAVLSKKNIKVERFVRVACPAAGTTLVSDRMDTLLNVLFNIFSNMPFEVVSSIAEGLKALVMAVVDEKNDPKTLPGIECMKPDSDFIKVLNFKDTQIDSELFVIAGDAQGEGFVNRLKMFLVDAFYREDNDLVVNTASMKRGTTRKTPVSVYDERRSNVNHFNYFVNTTSQNIIYDALAGGAPGLGRGIAQFDSAGDNLPIPVIEGPVSRAGKTIADQPVLYVLPGIMGSHLQDGGDRIWLNYLRMATGGLRRLKIDAPAITPSGINGSAYGDFVQYFSSTHYVIPYAYDWRKSVFDAADQLNKHVKQSLKQTAKTISFMVHSMGGLVLRAFAVKHPDTWKELNKRANFRVLMLGTPNQGSYDIPRILLGIGKNINLVSILDITQSKKTLLQQFIRYPGLLNLLPAFGDIDFTVKDNWTKIMSAARSEYPIPDTGDLTTFSEMLAPAFKEFQWDPAVVCYVAGKDDLTAIKMDIDTENQRIDFYGTAKGDGSVTWDSIPVELRETSTYYITAKHGDMANHAESYAGYRELLERGKTRLLSAVMPAARGGEEKIELMPQIDPAILTNEAELSKQIMGMEVQQAKPDLMDVSISITHGDMGHALYPVMAGHFIGDSIIQAEQVLNQKLDNYFTIRYEANNYPGKIGTHEILVKKDSRPAGGIVVGLGDFGGLTENTLYQTLKQALLSYITKCRELQPIADKEQHTVGISTLLIGSGFGGLTIYSCIRAIMMAVKEANDFFDPALHKDYPLIGHVEIVELYQHKAVQAARIIGSLLETSELFSGFVFQPDTIKRVSGSQNRIPDDIQSDWWHRLKVYESDAEVKENSKTRVIRFSSITDKARSEEEVLGANINIVDQLIAKTAKYSRNEPGLCETLYEMLIPYNFKGYGSDLRNIVLIVDKETARYPWEMLRDAYGGSADPIVTKAGFIRQLSTGTYRVNNELAKNDNAVVIGNPLLNGYYPNLPGAGSEAAMVADQLKERNFSVLPFINQPGADAIISLYSKSYKILHVAAHGVVNDKKTGQTGVVMGEELIITPSDFKQIRYVPELIFINCCSLGIINKEDEDRLQRKYEVAAGVGTQLVEMGAKAVIVAGWEVDDAAAKCFSETFYRFMLDGRSFGESVRFARKITYENFPLVNTWGAYQCYGDPFYTLRNSTGNKKIQKEHYYDIIEAVNRLETFISKLEAATGRMGDKQLEKLILELEAIIEAVAEHPEWKEDAGVLSLIGDAYKELDQMDKAIFYYEQLFSLENSRYSFHTVEQYCNSNIRYTVDCIDDLFAQNGTVDKDKLEEAYTTIEAMIVQLQGLGVAKTSERLSVLASAYKAKATLDLYDKEKIADNFDNLVKAAGYYRQSFEQFRKAKGKIYHYPLYNWLQLATVLNYILSEEKITTYNEDGLLSYPTDLNDLIQFSDIDALDMESIKPDFWNKTSVSMKFLVLLLKTDKDHEIEQYQKLITGTYQTTWKVEGSQKKIRSVIRYLELLLELLQHSNKAGVRGKVTALQEIVAVLEQLDLE